MKTSRTVYYKGYVLHITAHCHESGEWAGSYIAIKGDESVPPGGVSISGLHETSTLAENTAERIGKGMLDKLIDGGGE